MKGKTENDMDMTIKVTGKIIVALDRGYTVSAKLSGTVTIQQANEQMTLSGEGPMSVDVSSDW
jgi:hypothetical protein